MKNKKLKSWAWANPKVVACEFKAFEDTYKLFREDSGLNKKVKNIHEILTAMTDKHGRICRYIKHQERKDPKDNWQEEMASSLTGYLSYALMLFEYYGIDISKGMEKELNEAIKQHKK